MARDFEVIVFMKELHDAPENELAVIDESTLRSKIHTIRGQRVMLDHDLAEIYGYTTKAFNQQVKNNQDKFDSDFMFLLSNHEWQNLKSKNLTSSWGGRRTPPKAFTEQGIYMLMTVLKGDLAIEQSKTLIRLFKSMKDYISENRSLLTDRELLKLSVQTNENTMAIHRIEQKMVSRADLADFIKLFDQGTENDEVLILDGQPFKADEAYQKIYKTAKQSIVVIDDYIGIRTLHHLAHAKASVNLVIISDNKTNPPLKASEYNDFLTEHPDKSIAFIRSTGRFHDRYIILDENAKSMKVYHCGASSKDAGRRITTITRITDTKEYKETVAALLKGPALNLR